MEVGHLVDLVPDSFLQAAGELRPGILRGERRPQHLGCRAPEHVLGQDSSILTSMCIDIQNIQRRPSPCRKSKLKHIDVKMEELYP